MAHFARTAGPSPLITADPTPWQVHNPIARRAGGQKSLASSGADYPRKTLLRSQPVSLSWGISRLRFCSSGTSAPLEAQICVDGNDATRKRSVVHQPYRIASRTTGTCDCGPARADPQPGASTYGHTCSAPLLCLVQVQVLAIIVPRSTTSWEAILTPLWWSFAPNCLKSPVFAPAALRGTRFGLESRAVGRNFFA